jgi:cell division protease FtsH
VNATVKTFVFWLVICLSAFLSWQVVKARPEQKIPEISYSAFLSQVEADNVAKVTVSKNQVNGTYRDKSSFTVISQEEMLQTLRQKNVEIWVRDASQGDWPTWLLNLAPLVLLAALWFFMIRQMKQRQSSNAMNQQ